VKIPRLWEGGWKKGPEVSSQKRGNWSAGEESVISGKGAIAAKDRIFSKLGMVYQKEKREKNRSGRTQRRA